MIRYCLDLSGLVVQGCFNLQQRSLLPQCAQVRALREVNTLHATGEGAEMRVITAVEGS